MAPALKQQLFRKLVASDAPECPICMDMAQDSVVSECGHGPYCRECMNTVLNNLVRPVEHVHTALLGSRRQIDVHSCVQLFCDPY